MKTFIASTALVLCACSGDFCDHGSICKNDPPPSMQSVQACKDQEHALQAQPCYGERVRFQSCIVDNTKCTTDGHADPVASNQARTANCATQVSAYQKCCAENAMSAACTM